ncbi:MAG TPA: RNA polymerase sigma factor [Silvibacterium sp.]|jgi:RNA polymerase sigma-70 factor (ECF subfamily)|nr:RNA polymerase sigma factor [Silvibacterium sp.]
MSTLSGQLTGWMAPALISEKAPAADTTLGPAKTLDSSEPITALVMEYSATLYRVAYSVMRNAAEAEDAVQEAFLRVLKHRDKLDGIHDHRVWLIRITWNVVLDKKRRSKTRPENDDIADFTRVLPSNDRRADDTLISSQEHNRILGLVELLPRKEREALLLSAVEELSTVQIAAILGTTESSIRSRIFRARRELSALLEKEGVSR